MTGSTLIAELNVEGSGRGRESRRRSWHEGQPADGFRAWPTARCSTAPNWRCATARSPGYLV